GRARRAGRGPGVELLLGRADRRLRPLPRQDAGVLGQGQQVLADRVQLPGEVGEVVLVGHGRPLGQQDVTGEHGAEVLAVQAYRTGGVAGRVDDLELDVGDLEDAAVR